MVTEEGIRDGVRQLLLPLWSTYYFFTLYANAADNYEAKWRTDSENVLDRYLLAKTRELVEDVTAELDALDSPMAAAKLRDFADVLTNWYVRRSRDRFWSGDDTDAFDTLFTVLETVARVAAPLIPLVAEDMWRGLTGERSVHLTDWPDATAFPSDHDLVASMDRVREIASSGLALRKARSLRVRLPLASLTVVSAVPSALAPFSDILRDELNVKAVKFELLEEGSLDSFGITKKLTVNARALGPRVGKQVQHVIKEAKAGNWETTADGVSVDGMALEAGEYELQMEAADESSAIAFLSDGGFVIIDTQLTAELSAEGLARDVIRAIQDARKAAGFDVSDRIDLVISADDASDHDAIAFHSAMIASETLAAQSAVQSFANELAAGTLEMHRTELAAGKYANTGALVIDITKMGATNV